MEHGLISRTTHQLTDKGKTPKCGFTHKVHPSMVHKEPTPPPPPPPPPPPSQSLSEMWSPEMFLPILKDSILPMVVDQLLKVKVDKIEDTINGGKIDFTIEEISMEKVMVPPEHTKIDVEDTNIIVSISHIELELKKFGWRYKKKTIPKIKSSGSATCRIRETSITVCFRIGGNGNGENQIPECSVKIGELDLHFSDSKAKLIYNLLLSAFKSTIKKQLEITFTEMAKNILSGALSGGGGSGGAGAGGGGIGLA
eukprot:TRINITY_DN209_c0_g1_i13.p1 TRINITY_DN209_c0_g1~~TRINITY_DN209_c0_g1_i13.p1  ORF type:complete len:254 (+),score=66.01 TRINITY_DN209_c0_g1_i13:635-1396(+)